MIYSIGNQNVFNMFILSHIQKQKEKQKTLQTQRDDLQRELTKYEDFDRRYGMCEYESHKNY